MKNLYYLLVAALLAMCVGLYGCPPSPTPGDDDDATPPVDDDDDDDDATADDDDDDFDFNGLSFSFALTAVEAGGDDDDSAGDDDDSAGDDDDATGDDDDATGDDDDSAGDDDDSAGDDDDSAGDDDDSAARGEEPLGASDVTIDFTFIYWTDINAGVRNCEQHIQLEGTADWGFGAVDNCASCNGLITLDPATAVDVSNPAADPDHCDPAVLIATGSDFGSLMIQPLSDTAYGDFLELAVQDRATMEGLELDAANDGGQAVADIQAGLDDFGLLMTHAAGTEDVEGSLGNQSGLSGVAATMGTGTIWRYYWYVFKNPETNPHEGADMDGDYGGQSFWVITFG